MENITENKETYLNFSQKRLPRFTSAGSGIYCGVPQCGTASYNKYKQKLGIRFFKFSENFTLFKVWNKTLVSIKGNEKLILFKSSKHHMFMNFISRQKRSKFPWVWDVNPSWDSCSINFSFYASFWQEKVTLPWVQALEKLSQWMKLKLI